MNSLPEFQTASEKLSSEEYQHYLQGLQLEDLTLEALDADINRKIAGEAETYTLKMERDFRIEMNERLSSALLVDYTIRGLSRGKQALRIKATYRLQFITKEEFPVEFFAIYGNVSAVMQTWPFLRELANALTSRMGMPRLSLPLLKDPSEIPQSKKKSA